MIRNAQGLGFAMGSDDVWARSNGWIAGAATRG
jgi:hypothetical protein